MSEKSRVATVIVTSDTCSKNPSRDKSGQLVKENLEALGFVVSKHIIEDDYESIKKCVKEASDLEKNCSLIITVGGTGLCPRDVTPDATNALYDRLCPGIQAALYQISLKYSPYAALSRLTSGIVGKCLVVNFPGTPRACEQCFDFLRGILSHALDQLDGDLEAVALVHSNREKEGKVIPEKLTDGQRSSGSSTKKVYTSLRLKPFRQIDKENITTENDPVSKKINELQISTPKEVFQGGGSVRHGSDSTQTPLQTESAKTESINVEEFFKKFLSIQNQDDPDVIEHSNLPKEFRSKSPYELVTFDYALKCLDTQSRQAKILETVNISISSPEAALDALGHVLASDLRSKTQVPNFRASTMDGYVLNIPQDLETVSIVNHSLAAKVVKDIDEFCALQRDECFRSAFFCYQVNTGDRVPEGCIAVVPCENTVRTGVELVQISNVCPGRYIRSSGSDINLTDTIKAGTTVGPIELGLLKSMGFNCIDVLKNPVIGVLSTGDELTFGYVGGQKNQNSVIDSNNFLLTALFKRKGYTVTSLGISRDNFDEILLKVTRALDNCDILVVTGGTSMGSRDYVKDVIEKIGAKVHFGRVNMKPGKPVAFASLRVDARLKFIFSLPGNPVSAYVTSIVLVIPFVESVIRNHFENDLHLSLNSLGDIINVKIGSILDIDNENPCYKFDGRMEFVRAQFMPSEGTGNENTPRLISVSVKQQSSRLMSVKDCDCFVIIEPPSRGLKFLVGQTYRALVVRN